MRFVRVVILAALAAAAVVPVANALDRIADPRHARLRITSHSMVRTCGLPSWSSVESNEDLR
jgi:hypothetical protein